MSENDPTIKVYRYDETMNELFQILPEEMSVPEDERLKIVHGFDFTAHKLSSAADEGATFSLMNSTKYCEEFQARVSIKPEDNTVSAVAESLAQAALGLVQENNIKTYLMPGESRGEGSYTVGILG